MNEQVKHSILFVDDEESILKSLHRLFRKEGYTILTAQGGEEGLKLLKAHEPPIAVIVSDQKMPNMSGSVFLEKAKAVSPDSIRILLTGYSDMGAIVSAVNRGEIHRYLTKPWNDDELIMHVRKAVEQYGLIEENKRLVKTIRKQNKQLYDFGKSMEKKIEERSREIEEKNKALEFLNKELEIGFYNTIRAFAALMDMAHPGMKGHGKRVSTIAVDMGRKLKLDDELLTDIEIAALLHDIGIIAYSDELVEKYRSGRCSKEDAQTYRNHPVEGEAILSFISRLDNVVVMIRHHHERYDGKGYPDQLFETEIPLGSRIIAVADIYDRLTEVVSKKNMGFVESFLTDRNLTPDLLSEEELLLQATLFYIKKQSFTKYDPEMVRVLMDVLKDKGVNLARERKMTFNELEPGMYLTRSLYTSKGRFILPHKTEMTSDILEKIKIILSNNELPDVFYVVAK